MQKFNRRWPARDCLPDLTTARVAISASLDFGFSKPSRCPVYPKACSSLARRGGRRAAGRQFVAKTRQDLFPDSEFLTTRDYGLVGNTNLEPTAERSVGIVDTWN